jgi:uncharacterized membrane protein
VKTFLSTWWEKLSSSYWFLPGLIALGAIGFSALTLHIDGDISPEWARSTAWLWAGGAEGARNVLATIASSIITVSGVVFSITVVTLTLASSQFGPRLLRNFMNDRGTQLVLGVFVGTFLYCLLVLRAIRGLDQATVVPFLSVTCGVAFAVASVGFLIFFIHHTSTSIIAENIIGRVADDLMNEIDSLYPEKAGIPGPKAKEEVPEEFNHNPASICSERSGFIQAIAMETLLDLANRNDLIVRLRRRPGDFVAEGALLAEVVPSPEISSELRRKLLDSIFFGRRRTPTQDIEYSIDQLVEVAVRALSPSAASSGSGRPSSAWPAARFHPAGDATMMAGCESSPTRLTSKELHVPLSIRFANTEPRVSPWSSGCSTFSPGSGRIPLGSEIAPSCSITPAPCGTTLCARLLTSSIVRTSKSDIAAHSPLSNRKKRAPEAAW